MTTKILHHNHIHEGVREQVQCIERDRHFKGVKPIKVWFKKKVMLLNKIKPEVIRLSCTISLMDPFSRFNMLNFSAWIPK